GRPADALGDADLVETGGGLPALSGATEGARLPQVADDLVEEKGVALGLAPQRLGQGPVLLSGLLAGAGEQGGNVVGREAAELDAGERVVAAEVGEERGDGVGAGEGALSVCADDGHVRG